MLANRFPSTVIQSTVGLIDEESAAPPPEAMTAKVAPRPRSGASQLLMAEAPTVTEATGNGSRGGVILTTSTGSRSVTNITLLHALRAPPWRLTGLLA